MQSRHDFMHNNRFCTRRLCLTGLTAGCAWPILGAKALAASPSANASISAPISAPIRVAAASDLKFALAELALRFERETGLQLAITYGSSGHLARQLEQGLPMDVFFSADEALIFRLAKSSWARDEGVVYGRGQLVWMVPKSSDAKLDENLKGLLDSLGNSGKLAIANPDHAPYGRAAQAALQALGIWPAVQSRLVLGESVTQATQFVSTGAARAGIGALSLALSMQLATELRYQRVNPNAYPPIVQRMALRRNPGANVLLLYAYMQSLAAKQVFAAYGLADTADKK